jgi:hypothetical protein
MQHVAGKMFRLTRQAKDCTRQHTQPPRRFYRVCMCTGTRVSQLRILELYSGPQCATRVPVCCVTPVRVSLHCIAPHCSKSSGNSNHGVRISNSKNMVRYYISLEIIYSANENAMRLLYLNEIYKKCGVHTTAPHPYTKGTTTPVPEIGKQTRFINGPVAESQLGSCLCTRDKKGDHANAVVC